MGRPKNILKDVWKRINKRDENDCWEWVGGKDKDGYGRMMIDRHNYRTHRLTYIETYGSIPEGLIICHRCNNPSCCNPNHLYAGTIRENSQQCTKEGRRVSGEKHYKTILSDKDILKIRSLYSTGTFSQRELGRMFGVTQAAIWYIINNKTRKYILTEE